MKLKTSTLDEQVYYILRDWIASGEAKPGSRVDVGLLCGELGVSPTPITTALRRLSNDGLIEIRPRQGTYVRMLDAEDIRELFDIRTMIELWAVGPAIRNATEEDDAVMATLLQKTAQCINNDGYWDFGEFLSHDSELHGHIVDLARNRRLTDFYRNVKLNACLLGAQLPTAMTDAQATHREHEQVVRALTERDQEGLARAFRTHEENRAAYWLKAFGS